MNHIAFAPSVSATTHVMKINAVLKAGEKMRDAEASHPGTERERERERKNRTAKKGKSHKKEAFPSFLPSFCIVISRPTLPNQKREEIPPSFHLLTYGDVHRSPRDDMTSP